MAVTRVPKSGRHRLPDERRRRWPIMMFVSEKELKRLDREAAKVGMPRATYMRWRLLYQLRNGRQTNG